MLPLPLSLVARQALWKPWGDFDGVGFSWDLSRCVDFLKRGSVRLWRGGGGSDEFSRLRQRCPQHYRLLTGRGGCFCGLAVSNAGE